MATREVNIHLEFDTVKEKTCEKCICNICANRNDNFCESLHDLCGDYEILIKCNRFIDAKNE